MPDRPLTTAAYAAGASIAAITVFYVFGPTFFDDGENSFNTASSRKRGIIGLSNPANDCFINSVLQALAGLGDLRLYLIQEVHRRDLDGFEVHEIVADGANANGLDDPDKTRELQQGLVTRSIKDMLDALDERPTYRKTISARPLIEALERAFKTRISRTQQDAQEFLQVLAERLCDEYHAALKARKKAATSPKETDATCALDVREGASGNQDSGSNRGRESLEPQSTITSRCADTDPVTAAASLTEDTRFPLEGKLESQIQCQSCRFRTKASNSDFVTLTLNVPQKSSTTLDHCFDILLKTEDIDDFKCDKCRLEHAIESKTTILAKTKSEIDMAYIKQDIKLIQKALIEDPEKVPEGVELPPLEKVPKRRIKKYMRITSFPKTLAIHLSRSIFDPGSISFKNAAKVAFPERLRLGGILDARWYKLLAIVCHKGSHNSGHYESFRRNYVYPPVATADAFGASSAQSKTGGKATASDLSPTTDTPPRVSDAESRPSTGLGKSSAVSPTHISSASIHSPTKARRSSKRFSERRNASIDEGTVSSESFKLLSRYRSHKSELSRPRSSHSITKSDVDDKPNFRRNGRNSNDRWWRISDDKIKECKTSNVLSMQKEVYLLFYELEHSGDDEVA